MNVSLPEITACLVCELIREEAQGKLSILGFFGISPHVSIRVQHLDQPSVLTFLFSGGPCEGSLLIGFDVIDATDERVIAAATGLPYIGNPASPSHMASTLMMTFGHPGFFIARITVNGEERFRAPFQVAAYRSV